MKFVIVGFGIQGRKRKKILGKSCIGIVDIKNLKGSNYRKIEDVPLNLYQAVILCVPDKLKLTFINYCINNKKHVLVEKPLLFRNPKKLLTIEKKANNKGIQLAIAYNHRFEQSLIYLKSIIKKNKLGKIYNFKLKYLNGTAKNVFKTWRDKKGGVLTDLTPHLIDLVFSIFGNFDVRKIDFVKKNLFENKSYDDAIICFVYKQTEFLIEVSYCNWKNTFEINVNGKKGSIKISSLKKWGNSKFSSFRRILPSGVPIHQLKNFNGIDQSFKNEILNFKKLIKMKEKTNLERDYFINKFINKL